MISTSSTGKSLISQHESNAVWVQKCLSNEAVNSRMICTAAGVKWGLGVTRLRRQVKVFFILQE